MTKATPNNGNEKKPVIFLRDIFKSDTIGFFCEYNVKVFQ